MSTENRMLCLSEFVCLFPWNFIKKNFKQDELIRYYGYEAEEHKVTTEDGYILTVFRCNSRKNMRMEKKPVVLQHGIVCTSDEFCEHIPSQGLGIQIRYFISIKEILLEEY